MKYFSYLCTYKERFTILLSKPMDSTHISGKQLLFAYCITDGVLDEMTEEQQSSIISIIESLLSEGEDVISESCCREKTLRRVQKKIIIFFLPERPNNSLLDMTTRNDRSK